MSTTTDDDVLGWLTDHEWNLLLAGKEYAVLAILQKIRGMTMTEALNIIAACKARLT